MDMADGRGGSGGAERVAAWTVCLLGGGAAVWFLFRFAIGILWPFALAYLLSRCIRPLVRLAVGKSRLPRGVVAGVLVVLLVSGTSALAAWGIRRAVTELEGLVTRLSDGEGGLGRWLAEGWERLGSLSEHLPFLEKFAHIPGLENFCTRLDAAVAEAADAALTRLEQWASGAVMGMITGIPSMVLSLTVLFLACFYFSADDGRIGRAVGRATRRVMGYLLPSVSGERLSRWRARVLRMAGRYLRAYLWLAIITMAETFVGLSILRMPYAFLTAWLVALVDILPIFGAGAVLVPWALWQFLDGEIARGVGLLVLWAVMSVIRQILEPRLVSAGLGIHPLLSLLAMYGGWYLFGLPGMLLGPILWSVLAAAFPRPAAGEQEIEK